MANEDVSSISSDACADKMPMCYTSYFIIMNLGFVLAIIESTLRFLNAPPNKNFAIITIIVTYMYLVSFKQIRIIVIKNLLHSS